MGSRPFRSDSLSICRMFSFLFFLVLQIRLATWRKGRSCRRDPDFIGDYIGWIPNFKTFRLRFVSPERPMWKMKFFLVGVILPEDDLEDQLSVQRHCLHPDGSFALRGDAFFSAMQSSDGTYQRMVESNRPHLYSVFRYMHQISMRYHLSWNFKNLCWVSPCFS